MLENWPIDYEVSLELGKYDRWLGFVQGALWAMDKEEIDTFREDVRNGDAFEKLCMYLSEM